MNFRNFFGRDASTKTPGQQLAANISQAAASAQAFGGVWVFPMNHEDKPFSMPPTPSHSNPDEWAQQLLKGIAPANVRRRDGNSEIRLGTEWAEMLTTLPVIGEALILTGNPSAILGEKRRYPEIHFCCSGRHAQSEDGQLDFEFVPWQLAQAVTRVSQHKASHFVEFRDDSNTVFHKICLTEDTDADRFIEWVQAHQAWEPNTPPRFAIAPARWRTVQQRHWFTFDEIDPLPPPAVRNLLAAALSEGQALRFVVGNEGTSQSATLIPESLNSLEDWLFVSDNRAAFHFDTEVLNDAIIHHAPNPAGGPPFSTVKCFDEDGSLRFAITPPIQTQLDEWNEFLAKGVG